MIVAIAVAAGIVEFGQADDDQERRDLRDEGDVAGDEDDRAVFADGAGERQREAGQQRRQKHREDDARETSGGAWRRASRRPPPPPCSMSSSTGCTVRTTNGRPMKTSAMKMPFGV